MKKKLVSALLISTMALSAFVGCGDKAAETEAPATEATEAPAEEATTDPVEALIAATTDPVDLTIWCSEIQEWQDAMATVVDNFKAAYPTVTFNITIGAESEGNCKDDLLADPETAADVFVFADDQLNEMVKADAIQSLDNTYTYDLNAAYTDAALEAASQDGKLYAYPITKNGFFLYYDSTVFTAEDVASWETLAAAAEEKGVKVGMDFSNAWYTHGFYQGAGLNCSINEDGKTNSCDWNSEQGVAVATAIMNIASSSAVLDINGGDAQSQTDLKAYVDGAWDGKAFAGLYGDGYAATKLPTFEVNGTAVQQYSFSGYKLVGVNSYSKNKAWAMLLAEYVTDAESQAIIGNAAGEAVANANAQLDQSTVIALKALDEQAPYSLLQRIGGNYWGPANTLGATLASGTTDVQGALDEAVTGITAPVE